MKKTNFVLLLFFLCTAMQAQENPEYQKPPQEILDLVDVPLAPTTIVDSKGEMMILLYRDQYKSIAELSEQELRLGGLRINPVTNISSRATYPRRLSGKQIENINKPKVRKVNSIQIL